MRDGDYEQVLSCLRDRLEQCPELNAAARAMALAAGESELLACRANPKVQEAILQELQQRLATQNQEPPQRFQSNHPPSQRMILAYRIEEGADTSRIRLALFLWATMRMDVQLQLMGIETSIFQSRHDE